MDELDYMKQLVREYFDLLPIICSCATDKDQLATLDVRINEIEKELKELSGYED